MDAQIRKMTITPAKFDKEHEITTEEYATITLDVPMDSTEQREAIVSLMGLLDKEWVKVRIQSDQLRMETGQKPNESPQQAEIPA